MCNNKLLFNIEMLWYGALSNSFWSKSTIKFDEDHQLFRKGNSQKRVANCNPFYLNIKRFVIKPLLVLTSHQQL